MTLLSSAPLSSSVGRRLCRGRRKRASPSSLCFCLALRSKSRWRSFKQFESSGPELQMQDLAFARQHVIADVQTQHGGDVQSSRWHRQPGFLALGENTAAGFNRVQSFGAPVECFGIVFRRNRRMCAHRDPSKDSRTAHLLSATSARTSAGVLCSRIMKAGHHIGHLDAGVVDVILHFHPGEALAQHAHEGVA